jgi:excisionase family DNA binding protein
MMLSVKEAAKKLNCNPETIRRWCKAGKIPYEIDSRKRGYRLDSDVMSNCYLYKRDGPVLNTDPDTTGKRIKFLRKRWSLNLIDAAYGIGMDPGDYSSIERGRKAPSCKMIKRIAVFYGVATDYLLCMDLFKEEIQNGQEC